MKPIKYVKLKKSIRTKAPILAILLSIMIMVCGCGTDSDAEETMKIHLEYEEIHPEKDNNELDDTIKEELTAELLKAKNMDTSIIKSKSTTKGCTFILPEGFEESEDMQGLYLNEHYPVDASTIYYAILDKDTALQLMSENNFKENMEAELKQTYGSDVKLDIESFEKIKIDGYASFKILYKYTNDDINFTQLQYIINADKTYVITYSQTDEYDRMTEFAECAETIQVE